MSPLDYILIIAAVLIVLGLGFWIFAYIFASNRVYVLTLKKNSSDQWTRDNPQFSEPLYLQMDAEGQEWFEKHKEYKEEVSIHYNGLNLAGQYFNFGNERCVVFMSGRTESVRYGYYFMEPYSNNGFNVLLVDPRAHGLSEGKFNTVGFEEGKDIIGWINFLKEEKHIKSVVIHGICIGAAGGMYACTAENCPDILHGLITEGMFVNFRESMKNNLKERKKPVFIFIDCINAWMKHYTGHSMNIGPIDVIDKLDKPILMMNSKEDRYSRPEMAQKLFDKCASKNKELVFFDHGAHSKVRINDKEKYDKCIVDFLSKNFDIAKNKIII